MKYSTLILSVFLIGNAAGQRQFEQQAEWLRQQDQRLAIEAQRRQIEVQRRQVEEQRRALEQIQSEQRRAKRIEHSNEPVQSVQMPEPEKPERYTPTTQDRVYINRYIQKIQADARLSPASKAKLIRQILDSIKP